jgi:hypothetical protein
MTATTIEQPSGGLAWYARSAQDVTTHSAELKASPAVQAST